MMKELLVLATDGLVKLSIVIVINLLESVLGKQLVRVRVRELVLYVNALKAETPVIEEILKSEMRDVKGSGKLIAIWAFAEMLEVSLIEK
jgi:hypothetical protein